MPDIDWEQIEQEDRLWPWLADGSMEVSEDSDPGFYCIEWDDQEGEVW